MGDQLGFALIGCGGMGRSEAKLLSQIPAARLVAVCDAQEPVARAFGQEMGVAWYTDAEAVLARPDVAAVMVATPNTLHTQLVLDAAASGKHIFCEKPFALTVAECDQMIAAAERHGVRLMVGQVLRLLPLFARVIELFDSGQFGRPVTAQLTRTSGFSSNVPPYRLTRRGAGGLLYDVTVHEIDLLHRLFGPTRSVFAHIDRFVVPAIDYEDTVQLQLRFVAGGSASLLESLASSFPSFAGLILAEHGTVAFDSGAGRIKSQLAGGEPVTETIDSTQRENGYVRELRSFTEWVLHGQEPLLTAREGRAAIAVVEAAYASARAGQAVAVAE